MANRAERTAVAAEIARLHDGVAHRRDLRQAGIDRFDVRAEVRAGRWSLAGRHTVVVHAAGASGTHTPSGRGRLWWAIWESGAGAVLDGAAALVAAGLTGFTLDAIDVTVPNANRHHTLPGVRIHSRRDPGPATLVGLRRARPDWATIRAAQWAATDRTAVLLVCLPVQQRLVPAGRLLDTWRSVGRSPRRTLLDRVVQDVCDGAQSLGEFDFAQLCRRFRVPPPTRQRLREEPGGRYYLDNYWEEQDLVVEIDGSHHVAGLNPVDDALRQNELAIGSARVLRIPLLGLRLTPERFMLQVRAALSVATPRSVA